MRLFHSPTSPYARKVRVCLLEKGIAEKVELIAVNPLGNDTDELVKLNPLGKVPALVLDDDRVVIDSRVICEWLDAFAPALRLIPVDLDGRLDVLTRQAIADGVCDAAFNMVMESRRAEAQRSLDWTERWTAAIHRGVKTLSAHVTANRFDLGDIATAVALLYLDFRHAPLDWRDGNPMLANWVDRAADRSSLAQTEPPV